MENNNDFTYKFDHPQKSSSRKTIYTTILTSFISAIVGGACALGIYVNVSQPKAQSPEAVVSESTSASNFNNLNLSQVSLSNYSDTAIYAASKVLPSMVSISIEYDVTYLGRTRYKYWFWLWSYN